MTLSSVERRTCIFFLWWKSSSLFHVPICDWMLSITDYNNLIQYKHMVWSWCGGFVQVCNDTLCNKIACVECIVRNTKPKDQKISQGRLSIFSAPGYVPDISPRECIKNTVPRAVFPNTLPGEQGVYWKIWSLLIVSFDIIPSSLHQPPYEPHSMENSQETPQRPLRHLIHWIIYRSSWNTSPDLLWTLFCNTTDSVLDLLRMDSAW